MAIKAKVTNVELTSTGKTYQINYYEESTPGVIIDVESISSGGNVEDLAIKKHILKKCEEIEIDIVQTGNVNALQIDDVFGMVDYLWQTEVENGIQAKIQAGVIEKGTIKEINAKRKLAVVEVYMFITTQLVNRLYLVYEDKDQTFQFEQIIQE